MNQGLQVDSFTADKTDPELAQFIEFDKNSGEIILSFTETINASSVRISNVYLQDWYQDDSSLNSVIQLSRVVVLTADSSILKFRLSIDDLNLIKADSTLCNIGSTCWIRFNTLFVQDMSGNQIVSVLNSTTFQETERADQFIRDTTPPNLVRFELDLNDGTLLFSFDETVDVQSFDALKISFTNSVGNVSLTLTGSNILTSSNAITSSYRLLGPDLVSLKANDDLVTSDTTTSILYTNFIQDTSSNAILSINASVQVSNYIGDTTPPFLVEFSELDMNQETMIFSFNEPMTETIIDFSQIILYGVPNTTFISLTGAKSITALVFRTEIVISLTDEDVRSIKIRSPNIATNEANSFVSLQSSAFQDTSGNPVVPSVYPNPVISFIADTKSPELLSFDLDMNTGVLLLTFDDVMDIATVRFPEIGFQGVRNNNISSIIVFLTGGSVSSSLDYEITIQITPQDLDNIKASGVARFGTRIQRNIGRDERNTADT